MPLARSAKNSLSSAISVQAMTIKPVCRRAQRELPCVSGPQPSLVQPKIFFVSGQARDEQGENDHMALTTKPPTPQQRAPRQLWKTPTSKARWFWLIVSVVLYIIVFAIYYPANKNNPSLAAADEPLLFFGVIAYLMVLG